jgi:SAM-dependent methyltransferase
MKEIDSFDRKKRTAERRAPRYSAAMGGVTGDAEAERDYVLGTQDEEIARLGLQHRVWRPRALAAWRRAGFNVGQTLLDVGSGPGHASLDLAELVGPTGRVFAIDRSRRFLDAVLAACRTRGLANVTTVEQDLDDAKLPEIDADGAWCRWVFAFLKKPRELLARLQGALKPGAVLVAHEYLDYSTWRLAPRSSAVEEFVRVVIEAWRASGGEPDRGLDLPGWLSECGFECRSLRPIVDVVAPSNFVWQWPKAFVHSGLRRLVELGHLTEDRSDAIAHAFAAAESAPGVLMVTPAVLEVIAVRR